MKSKKPSFKLVLLFSAVAMLFLAGCATQRVNTTNLLTAAGFRARTPQTPKQQQIYASLPSYKVERAVYKGKTFYVYKDEQAGVAYVGRESEYQAYKRLCIQQQIAQDYYSAAAMDRATAVRWYGAWGARAVWW
jgi:hypothetical protein